jgi:GNAT superfamily N-acetyltransferase
LDYTIRRMLHSDIVDVAETFARKNKKLEQYERYFEENQQGVRVTLVAAVGEAAVGYANILWQPDYEPFLSDGIPEINDLNVIDEYQNRGIGTALIREAERIAAEAGKPIMGIGVGLTPDYEVAQNLYPKLGYISDGRGIRATQYGDVVYLTKRL